MCGARNVLQAAVLGLLLLASAVARAEEQEKEYRGKGYGDFKGDLAAVLVEFVTPFRDRTLELLEDRAELDRILEDGSQRAAEVASRTLADVYDRVGFVPQTQVDGR